MRHNSPSHDLIGTKQLLLRLDVILHQCVNFFVLQVTPAAFVHGFYHFLGIVEFPVTVDVVHLAGYAETRFIRGRGFIARNGFNCDWERVLGGHDAAVVVLSDAAVSRCVGLLVGDEMVAP